MVMMMTRTILTWYGSLVDGHCIKDDNNDAVLTKAKTINNKIASTKITETNNNEQNEDQDNDNDEYFNFQQQSLK